jgi:hypothetical protein
VVLGDFRIQEVAAQRLEAFERALLIRAHQPRIPRDIGGENGSQPAFDASGGQSGAPQPHGPKKLSAQPC